MSTTASFKSKENFWRTESMISIRCLLTRLKTFMKDSTRLRLSCLIRWLSKVSLSYTLRTLRKLLKSRKKILTKQLIMLWNQIWIKLRFVKTNLINNKFCRSFHRCWERTTLMAQTLKKKMIMGRTIIRRKHLYPTLIMKRDNWLMFNNQK